MDQLALSEMIKATTTNRNSPLDDFWRTLKDKIERLLLLQQAVFPNSPIHLDESLLSSMYGPLSDLYESVSGEVSFLGEDEISRGQIVFYAEHWLRGETPKTLPLKIESIVRGRLTSWLNVLRVQVNSDFSSLIQNIRQSRDNTSDELSKLFEIWRSSGDTFSVALNRELSGWSREIVRQIINLPRRYSEAQASSDPLALFNVAMSPANNLFSLLRELFARSGVPEDKLLRSILEFLLWDELKFAPQNKISSYLFAALARKAASGQKRPPTRGTMNDVKVISCYGPYVDAMYIDNECAALLSEEPLKSDLPIKAKIYSTNTRKEFLEYLDRLENDASPEFKHFSRSIYGTRF